MDIEIHKYYSNYNFKIIYILMIILRTVFSKMLSWRETSPTFGSHYDNAQFLPPIPLSVHHSLIGRNAETD